MALDRTLAEDLASSVAELYADAQLSLVERMAKMLATGIDSPDWLTRKLAALNSLERSARAVLAQLDKDTQKLVAAQVEAAYARGGAAAASELGQFAMASAQTVVPQSAAIQRLVHSTVTNLRGTHLQVVRSTLDAYRTAIAAGGAGDVLTGVLTRRQATQRAWSALLGKGITGFTDVRGRSWNLASYAEMAMRTTVAHAAVEGGLDRMTELGLDLVIVSNSAQECKLCRPWEGKILSRSGGGERNVFAENPATGRKMKVHVSGSLDDAVRAGLMHPNCRHSISPYLPGLTEVPTNTQDPKGDQERQRLRALERRLRRLKTQELGAIDPAAKARYAKLAKNAQGDIRTHLASSSKNLFRKPERERVNLGHKAPTTAAPPKIVNPKAEPPAPRVVAPPKPKIESPAVLTGTQDVHWKDALKVDTGLDSPVLVRDYEVLKGIKNIHDPYVMKSGKAYRVDGITYLVEDGTKIDARRVVEEFRTIHSALPGASDYQTGYAWLKNADPADGYWRKRFNNPSHVTLASAGDGAVRVWGQAEGIFGPLRYVSELRHEFGHNVSTAAKRLHLDDESPAWRAASAERSTGEPIDWRSTSPFRLIFEPQAGRESPNAPTGYGASHAGEDYAESMALYLSGVIGSGRIPPGRSKVVIYFRDLWPARARIFDQLFPEIAKQQKAAIASGRI